MQQDQFDELGSSIVALGNNFATTESEIVDFGLRIAGAGELAGLSEGDILGIGTAMSSIGVQAEAGGTAVQKVLNEINQSVATGDKELQVFAEVAGMTAEQFAAAFRQDAAGAFETFVAGLGEQGDKSFTVMEDLGLQSERVIRAFLGLANSGDLLSEAMEEGNRAFEENVALMIEAEQRYGTTESRLTLLWNRVRELGITLGDNLVPAIHSFIDIAGPMLTFATDSVKWWAKWPGPLKAASLAVVALVAAIGPALLIGGTLLTSWASIVAVFPAIGLAAAAAGVKVSAFWVALTGPIGWVIAGIAAVGGAIYAFREELGLVKQAAVEAKVAIEAINSTLPAFAVTLDAAKSQLAQAERGLNQMAAAGMVVDAEMEDWVERLKAHVAALRETKTATDAVSESLSALVAKWTGARFDVEEFNAAFARLNDEQLANVAIMGEVMGEYETARAKLGPFNDELELLFQAERRAADEAARVVDVTEIMGYFFLRADEDAKELAERLAELEGEAEEVVKELGSMEIALAALESGLGGASGQSINLFTAMREHNDELEEGQKKFGKARMGASLLSGGMKDLADQIGGMKGAILSAGSSIASAFATGGVIGGAIAGITAGIKGLFSWFGRGKRKAEEARAAAEALRVKAAEDAIKAEIALAETIFRLETEKHELVLEGIDAEIAATEEAKSAALSSLSEQIEAVRTLTAERLNAVKIQLEVAQGAVVDVSATKGIAKRLNVDISDATVFGAQAASERITALAEDIATLQKAGVEISAGISEEFDAEMRAAVKAVNRFGVTIPESLRTIVSTFPGIELEALAFGDGLTEAARRVKELEEARDQIQADANERLQELAIERQEIEELFDGEIRALAEVRKDAEAGFVHGLEDISVRRAQVEEDLAAAVEVAAKNLRDAALAGTRNFVLNRDGLLVPEDDYERGGFARGTRGEYIDFGSSSTVKLHGKERIMTEDEGRREASSNAASLRGVEDRLDRLDKNLQRAIKRISTDVTNVVMTKGL